SRRCAMGLLDQILGGLASGGLGGLAQGNAPAASGRQAQAAGGGAFGSVLVSLLPVVLEMMASRSTGAPGSAGQRGPATGNLAPGGSGGAGDLGGLGGLGGLLEQLQKAGLGQQASSWIGTGSNMPIDREDVTNVFGRERVGQIAKRAGISEEEAS